MQQSVVFCSQLLLDLQKLLICLAYLLWLFISKLFCVDSFMQKWVGVRTCAIVGRSCREHDTRLGACTDGCEVQVPHLLRTQVSRLCHRYSSCCCRGLVVFPI